MSGPLVQAIGWSLLHLLWQGVLVAAILAATLALLQRQSASARYLASCGALLLLVVLGIVTGYRTYDASVAAGASPAEPRAAAPTLASVAPAASSLLSIANAHLPEIVAVWLAGVLILSTRLVVGWIGAHRLTTRRSHAAGDPWERALTRIASALQLHRSVRLLESAAVEVPTVIGWLRPVVLLPVASLSGLSTQQVEMILAHELAHIRRHDFIVNLVQSVMETLLFYHPAVWWISRRIRVEREHCCDDLAVSLFGDPLVYARALTRFEELRFQAPQSAMAASGGSLIGRIRRLVAAQAESANWPSRWAAGAALLAVVAAIVLAPALPVLASHDDPPAPKPAKAEAKCDPATTPHVSVDVEAPSDDADDPEVDANAEPVVQAVREGVKAGVRDGVLGGIRAVPFVHVVPNINVDKIVTTALESASAAVAELGRRPKRRIGEGGKLSIDDLIILRSAGVDLQYIEQMRGAGLGELSLDDLVVLRLQGVTPAYVKEMAAAGYAHLSVEELVRLKASGVDANFIRDLAKCRAK